MRLNWIKIRAAFLAVALNISGRFLTAEKSEDLYVIFDESDLPTAMREHVRTFKSDFQRWIRLFGSVSAHFGYPASIDPNIFAVFTLGFEGNNPTNCFNKMGNIFKFGVIEPSSTNCAVEFTIHTSNKITVKFANGADPIVHYDCNTIAELLFMRDGWMSYDFQRRKWCDATNTKYVKLTIFSYETSPCGALLILNENTHLAANRMDYPKSSKSSIQVVGSDSEANFALPKTTKITQAPTFGKCFSAKGEIHSTETPMELYFLQGGTGEFDANIDKVLLRLEVSFRDRKVSLASLDKWGGTWQTSNDCPMRPRKSFDFLICFARISYTVLVNGEFIIDHPYNLTDYSTLDLIHYIRMVGDASLTRWRFVGRIFPAPFSSMFMPHFEIGQTLTIYGRYYIGFSIVFIRGDRTTRLIFEFNGDKVYYRNFVNFEQKLISDQSDNPYSGYGAFKLRFQMFSDWITMYIGDKQFGNYTHGLTFDEPNNQIRGVAVPKNAHLYVLELDEVLLLDEEEI